jgi:DNA-binding transcriptional regulator YiaG
MGEQRYASILEGFSSNIGEKELSKARHRIDPDLLKEKDLGDKLTTLRKITKQTNGSLANLLQENKRTFESWVSGRYVPEGDKLKKVNNLLLLVGLSYIEEVQKSRNPGNIYTGFPVLFKLLDFNDAITLLVSYFNEQGKSIDYDSGAIIG